jgi:serine/threonine protein phosphatase 1
MKTFVVGDIHGRCAQLHTLLELIPRDEAQDTLVFLGDLIDRGFDAPGCVEHVIKLQRENPERTICLRGNHEQMLMDFIDGSGDVWVTPVTGGERTFEQYTGRALTASTDAELAESRRTLAGRVPAAHLASPVYSAIRRRLSCLCAAAWGVMVFTSSIA